jgi:hypothetical protein
MVGGFREIYTLGRSLITGMLFGDDKAVVSLNVMAMVTDTVKYFA